jgi:hypothetical protein
MISVPRKWSCIQAGSRIPEQDKAGLRTGKGSGCLGRGFSVSWGITNSSLADSISFLMVSVTSEHQLRPGPSWLLASQFGSCPCCKLPYSASLIPTSSFLGEEYKWPSSSCQAHVISPGDGWAVRGTGGSLLIQVTHTRKAGSLAQSMAAIPQLGEVYLKRGEGQGPVRYIWYKPDM